MANEHPTYGDCPHRRHKHATTIIDGQLITVYRCVLEGSCTLTPCGLTRSTGEPLAVCAGCHRQDEQPTEAQLAATRKRSRQGGDCIHRGDVIRSERCELCGSQAGPKGTLVQISSRNIFGECAPSRYKSGQSARACSSCERRE